jgi:hypothetical protein
MSESTEQCAAAAESETLSPVEIPTLKSLFVELRFGETVLGNATAFLAANDQKAHCALITNRHVVTAVTKTPENVFIPRAVSRITS